MPAAIAAVLAAAAAAPALPGGSSRAAPAGMIVFASDREKADPGEIYSLAPGSAPRNVSRSLGGDYGVAVAPAGDAIAFWSGRTGTDRVYLARPDGSHARLVRLVRGSLAMRTPGSGGLLAFSADGSRLYAAAYVTPPRQFVIDVASATARPIPACNGIPRPSPDLTRMACGVNGATAVSDLLTGRVRFRLPGIVPLWSARGWVTAAPDPVHSTGTAVVADAAGVTRARVAGIARGWSPDGRRLVLQRGRSLWVAGPGDLSRTRRLLADWGGGLLSFTPDGRSVSTESHGAPVLIPLAGGPAVRGLDAGTGAWSRDGRLAYADFAGAFDDARKRAGAEIAVLVTDTHGRNPRVAGRFPFDDHNYSDLRWLPGGRRVLFVTGTTCGGSGLFAVPPGGGPARPLTHDPRSLEDPVWSPDGSRLAFSVQKFTCHLGAGLPIHIASAAADGSDARRVTDDGDVQQGSFDRFPSYSPDGRRIVFAHGSADSASLQIAAAEGGGRTSLPTPGGDLAAEPAWSPDGRRIAYARGRSVLAVAPGGGTPEVLARGLPRVSCGTGGLAWSPDGRRLAVARGAGIYLVTVGEPAGARLAIRARCAGNPSFSPDGTRIAFDAQPAHALGGQTAIMVAGIDGSGVRTLSTVPFRQSLHPAWRPAP